MTFISKIVQTIKGGLKNSTVINVIIVGSITLLVSGLGFVKEMVIADSFGLSEVVDTFLIAVLIPTFINNVFLGAFQSVFIPNYIAEVKSGAKAGAFQTASFLITFAVSVLFIVIAILLTDTYLDVFYSGHTEQYYNLVKTQFYYLVPCIFIWGFSSLIKGLLNIDDEFTNSTLSQVSTPLIMILCLLFFKEELGSLVLSIGMLIGSIITFIWLLVIAIYRKIIQFASPNFKSKNIKTLFNQLPAKLSSGILSGLNKIIDQYFAATLVVGSIAALNYGIKIPMFFIGILVMALGNVLLPYFSKKALENRTKTFKELKKLLKYLVLGSSIIALLFILLSTPIISLLFERNAFTSSDTLIVSAVQKMYLLQVPTYIVGIVMVRFLTAINKNNFMVIAAIIALILNILFNYVLMDIMGIRGLALATSLVSLINCIVLYLYINYLSKKNI